MHIANLRRRVEIYDAQNMGGIVTLRVRSIDRGPDFDCVCKFSTELADDMVELADIVSATGAHEATDLEDILLREFSGDCIGRRMTAAFPV
ncbi:MAG: hypothetical protein CL534_11365 [Ahrensia sp.]|nr:hypothetical protein [Ahrensia sp.]